MKNWITPGMLVFLLAISFTSSSCNRNGCPAEIQSQKVKKKKNLKKSAKTNLFSPKMRKTMKSPKF